MDLQFVVLGHRAANGRDHFTQVRAPHVASFQLLDDDQLLTFVGRFREGRTTLRAQSRVAPLRRLLYVLWVMIESPDNDEVL